MHAGPGFFQQGDDAGDRERHVGAQLRTVDGERTQSHLAHDEAHAQLDTGLQQGFEVADPALPVEASRSQSSSGGGGPIRARMPAMVKNSTAGLLTATAALAIASA